MTRQEANERIVLSRHRLGIYRRAVEDRNRPAGAEVMIREEMAILDGLAADFLEMEDKLANLVAGWSGVLVLLEAQLH